jgi:hypothetical protein
VLGDVRASGRIAKVVTITTFAILIAAGCGLERTPPPGVDGRPVVVAARDEATAGRLAAGETGCLAHGHKGS